MLCGGSGTRLWPLSRKDFAKQHAPVLGGEAPFQDTLRRLAGPAFARPIVVANAMHADIVEEQLAAVQATAATVDEITHSGAQISKRATEVIATAQATAQPSRTIQRFRFSPPAKQSATDRP